MRTAHTAEALPSVGETPTMRRNEPGSDHAAIVANFDLEQVLTGHDRHRAGDH